MESCRAHSRKTSSDADPENSGWVKLFFPHWPIRRTEKVVSVAIFGNRRIVRKLHIAFNLQRLRQPHNLGETSCGEA